MAQQVESFADEERRVEAESSVFKKELGLTDLVLIQILFIVGLPWVGVAAKQGPSHIVLWLVGILLFYIPSAVVVIHLNRAMPLEGGLYQWAKLGLGDAIGFITAWNLWLYVILQTSEIGLQLTQYVSYVIGPEAEWLNTSPLFIAATNAVVISALVAIAIIGLGLGKWVSKAGAVLMLVIFAAILVLPLFNLAKGTITEYHPLNWETPAMTLMTFNLLGKMGFGALGGFEYVAIHAGESRNPARSIARSVWISAPIIALMFILGTSSVLALIPQDQIDLIAPIPQILTIGSKPLGAVAGIASITVMAMLVIRVAQSSFTFGGNTRLPMVAGWDGLLPGWFTRLHPRYKTPVNSILFVGAATLVMSIVGSAGVGKQEAFQLLWNASGLFYAVTYVVLFSIPLVGLRGSGTKLPLWLKLASASGLAMTLLYVGLSVVPIVEVESRLAFGMKIAGLIIGANLIGFVIYRIAGRRMSNPSAASES
jgi:amino acid transporter